MFNALYRKCIELAAHKSSKYYLAIVSFLESSFFPIPPDVMVIPMVISKKNDFIKIFFIATLFSVLGGILGYFIGAFFFDIGMQIMSFYGYEEKLNNLKNNLINSESFYAWLGILFLNPDKETVDKALSTFLSISFFENFLTLSGKAKFS